MTTKKTVDVDVLPPPVLTAAGAFDSIGLEWSLPPVFSPFGFVKDFVIYRATTPEGVYPDGEKTTVPRNPVTDGLRFEFLDMTVQPDVTYYYVVAYLYDDAVPYGEHEAISNIASASTRTITNEGPMDVAFILDNTGSMGNELLTNLKGKIGSILNAFEASSENDYRLALITPDDDQVNVRVAFPQDYQPNRAAFEQALSDVVGTGGGSDNESTDECLNTVLHAKPAGGRDDPDDCAPPEKVLQLGNATPFRSNVRKLVVLITDAPPDGFCDDFYPHIEHALLYAAQAHDASNGCIRVNAIQVEPEDSTWLSTLRLVMQAYAETSCGWYSSVSHDGGDIVRAVLKMIYESGHCDCP